jgi:beta-1,4-mannosyltransferase
MKDNNVVFVPNWSNGNPYLDLLKESCEEFNCKISYDNFSSTLFPLFSIANNHPKIDIIHIHWVSQIIFKLTWSNNIFIFWIKCLALILDCFLVRIKGVKLIWTIHNKVSHENYNRKKELIIRRILCACVNKIILHSEEALNEVSKFYRVRISNKTKVIFHGNYVNCYPPPSQSKSLLRSRLEITDDDIVILFFGALKPYKGIETLISAFDKVDRKNLKLIIAGTPCDDSYKQSLVKLCQFNKKITTDLQFISNTELSNYLFLADVVVLPFSDTLTSGSTILAMTFGKALVLPDSAKIFGCVPNDGVEYFKGEEQLVSILNTLECWQLTSMGNANFLQTQNMNWQKVGKLTTELYHQIK